MEDKLTLEKLEISDRLTKVETKFDNAEKKLDDIHSALLGKDGLIIKVDRHEQIIQGWQGNIKMVWVAIVGLVVKSFWGIFKN